MCSASDVIGQQDRIHIDSLWIENDEVKISYRVDELLTENVLESLNKGISISVYYEITLWRVRNNWFDKAETLGGAEFRVKYSKFDQRYIWVTQAERRTTTSLDRIQRFCSEIVGFVISGSETINLQEAYYVTIKGVLKPHSIDNLDDVRNWLSGEVEDIDLNSLKTPEQSQEKLSGRVFNIFKNLTGFGDQQFSGTSRNFTISRDGKIEYTDRIILRN
ncbi:DUF4390 domain-containing protein [candidate division KSB1 bacterium]